MSQGNNGPLSEQNSEAALGREQVDGGTEQATGAEDYSTGLTLQIAAEPPPTNEEVCAALRKAEHLLLEVLANRTGRPRCAVLVNGVVCGYHNPWDELHTNPEENAARESRHTEHRFREHQWRKAHPPPPPPPGALGIRERARLYLASMPPSIQGSDGRGALFQACSALVRGFELGLDEALSLLEEYNARSEPPWSEKQLRARLENAQKTSKRPMGYLLKRGGK